MATKRQSIGSAGEAIAAAFLRRGGARIIRRNARVGSDEVDLIVRIDGEPIVVEVKTGNGPDSRPWENFDDVKRRRTRRAARTLGIHRVDLVTVEMMDGRAVVRWLPDRG